MDFRLCQVRHDEKYLAFDYTKAISKARRFYNHKCKKLHFIVGNLSNSRLSKLSVMITEMLSYPGGTYSDKQQTREERITALELEQE